MHFTVPLRVKMRFPALGRQKTGITEASVRYIINTEHHPLLHRGQDVQATFVFPPETGENVLP